MQNNIIDIKRTELNAVEPVSLDEAKKQCIVTYTDDDDYIDGLITMARKAIENYCNISIVAQTIILTADLYNEWELPYGPVTGLTSVQTRSGNEGSGPATYTTAASGWNTEGEQFLSFNPGGGGGFDVNAPFRGYFSWGPYASPYGAYPQSRYRITYNTGPFFPDDLRQAILLQVSWLYENRGAEQANRYDWQPGICEAAQRFADPYKRTLWQ